MVIVNNRDRLEWQSGMTVRSLLDRMRYSYRLITVAVNGQLVPHEDYEDFYLPDEAQVSVFHLAHGG
jgi:thiamine biosynthesis protein ThiS